MKRMIPFLAAAAGFLFAAPAMADDADAQKAADDALAEKAEIPAQPPTLPATASDAARNALDNIAFGKKGEAERAAHSKAGQQGRTDTDAAQADAANRAAQGAAASAAGAANADSHAAAGQARGAAARTSTTTPVGSNLPTTHRP